MPVYFYLPRDAKWDDVLPTSMVDYWPWVTAQSRAGWWGKFNWTLQTALRLQEAGVPCEIARSLPDRGVIIAHRSLLDSGLRPGPEQLFVCQLADRNPSGRSGQHPFAQIHVVQNPTDPWVVTPTPLWPAFHVPQWPQPGLRPRDAARGAAFEHAAFFGYAINQAPDLNDDAWREQLRRRGLDWRVPSRDLWHDYTDTDVVVAARAWDGGDYHHKPPSKLFNCWHAGVPAILGPESAYRAVRQSPLDYLEVRSVEEALAALDRLRADESLRRDMVEHGRRRAREVGAESLVSRWTTLIHDELMPAADRWSRGGGLARARFIARRRWHQFRAGRPEQKA